MIRVIFACFFLFSLTKILSQTVTITGDSVLCLGETTSLKATMTGSGYGTTNYVFEIIDFSTHPPFAGGEQIDPQFTGCTSSGNDDCFAPPDNPAPPNGYEIGFTFCFFNLQYSRFWV
jgi:hypothetical protein